MWSNQPNVLAPFHCCMQQLPLLVCITRSLLIFIAKINKFVFVNLHQISNAFRWMHSTSYDFNSGRIIQSYFDFGEFEPHHLSGKFRLYFLVFSISGWGGGLVIPTWYAECAYGCLGMAKLLHYNGIRLEFHFMNQISPSSAESSNFRKNVLLRICVGWLHVALKNSIQQQQSPFDANVLHRRLIKSIDIKRYPNAYSPTSSAHRRKLIEKFFNKHHPVEMVEFIFSWTTEDVCRANANIDNILHVWNEYFHYFVCLGGWKSAHTPHILLNKIDNETKLILGIVLLSLTSCKRDGNVSLSS